MSKVAIYPGTFDPITFGHIDVIKKGLKLFSSELINSIILLIHSTAAISAKAKLMNPRTLIKKDHLYLKVYPNNLFKLPCFIFQLF